MNDEIEDSNDPVKIEDLNKIISASLTKGRTIKYTIVETLKGDNGERKHPNVQCDQLATQDLLNGFYDLKKYYAMACELPDVIGLENRVIDFDNDLLQVNVTSFTISGEVDNEGVILSGNRFGKFGTIAMDSPIIKFNDENCPFAGDLLAVLCTLDYELKEYIFNEKWCQKQLTLFDEADAAGVTFDKPRKKRGKKGKVEDFFADIDPDKDDIPGVEIKAVEPELVESF
jgi:hypothetical protein